ncbi:hypothetical protein [Flavobacterium sp. S87F.05.LMB.W.Kidney.N]|uniref:hypothetical protein n=1 Tax=Flavobacterium sp. S87F.05.LMB.W.Kidney.N TaxID=1278758 RepID=UPI001064E295|nr:hypothetical protein [Flavobacterium sp. S87F.05.LMB.W.Kidney.N]
MLKIKSIQDIQNDLLINKKGIRNFPKSTSFPFDALYLDIVTQIKTVEISSECILLDSVHSYNENKEFTDPEYWKDNYDQKIIMIKMKLINFGSLDKMDKVIYGYLTLIKKYISTITKKSKCVKKILLI